MSKYGRGIKAGVFGITLSSVLLMFLLVPCFLTQLPKVEHPMFPLVPTSFAILMHFQAAVFGGISGGIIFGLVFAELHDSLPSESSVSKGAILGVVFGIPIIFLVQGGWPLLYILILLIYAPMAGGLVGVFWERKFAELREAVLALMLGIIGTALVWNFGYFGIIFGLPAFPLGFWAVCKKRGSPRWIGFVGMSFAVVGIILAIGGVWT